MEARSLQQRSRAPAAELVAEIALQRGDERLHVALDRNRRPSRDAIDQREVGPPEAAASPCRGTACWSR